MSEARPVCAICLSAIQVDEAKTACQACQAEYHSDCWQENGGCAAYGCSQVPVVEQRRAIEIPVSYWGQEKKSCPNCGQEIMAAAVRCRHCGTTFESARPQAAEEFQRSNELVGRLPAVRRKIVFLFVISMVTCLAPIAAVYGPIWFSANREEIRKLPTVFGVVCKIGIVVAIGQTVALIVITLLYSFIRK